MTAPGGPLPAADHAGALARTALLEAVVGSVSEGVAVVDGEGRYVLMNRAAKVLLGIDPESPEEWSKQGKTFRADGVTPFPNEEQPTSRALPG